LPDDRLDLVRKKLDKNGAKFLFAARFMPGLRAPIFFSAGTLHVSYWRFLLYNGSAAVLSVPAIIGAVYYFGEQFDHIVKIIRRAEHGIIIVILLALAAILGKWYLTHRKLKKT
jgi:membrane protein DedA with SNARE-associated domain